MAVKLLKKELIQRCTIGVPICAGLKGLVAPTENVWSSPSGLSSQGRSIISGLLCLLHLLSGCPTIVH